MVAYANEHLKKWVDEVVKLTKPTDIHFCDGSQQEYDALIQKQLQDKTLFELNQSTYPHCYLHRSHPSDVARTEHLTFVSTKNKADAGPNNNWLAPEEAHKKIDALFDGCMTGRTMYVIPYCMGPLSSPFSRCGVEITDSPYVAINMRIMTRMGQEALDKIGMSSSFVKGLHSIGDLSVDRRFIMHFPEELMIKSIGSGYGGNALLGKKCHALRIGSFQARREGWLAEHMLIVGIEDPKGQTHYIAAAFPSACGKTNLAMLIPPESYREKGWKVWTVGDDIAWIHIGHDGRFYAINPEAGYFGVAPGTSLQTNPNALNTLKHDAIFTNVAIDNHNQPWWDGLNSDTPAIDWQGRPFDSTNGPAAHPNSRFTVAAKQCPTYSPLAEHPDGVPLSAIIFGGRRPNLLPLVLESKSWEHGVLMGASVASETTAAATGAVGVLRRDPMAMQPFCGYNFGDYWQHWLSMGQKASKPPKIFHVNWFRQNKDKKYMWPGFGDNLRVIEWIIDRCDNKVEARKTPVGFVPYVKNIQTNGLQVSDDTMQELLSIDPDGWKKEMQGVSEFLGTFGDRTPDVLVKEKDQILLELNS